jgi:hypothetical protein
MIEAAWIFSMVVWLLPHLFRFVLRTKIYISVYSMAVWIRPHRIYLKGCVPNTQNG